MRYTLVLVSLIFLLMSLGNGILIRIRMANGQLQRVDLDEEMSFNGLYDTLASLG